MKLPGWMMKLAGPQSLMRMAAGWVCIGAGILGLVLPVIPGIPLLIAGLLILSTRYRWAAVCLRWLKRKVRSASGYVSRRKTAGTGLASTNRG